MLHIFHFNNLIRMFGVIYPFSWIFNAISSDKSGLSSIPFLLTYIEVRTVQFFPPTEF